MAKKNTATLPAKIYVWKERNRYGTSDIFCAEDAEDVLDGAFGIYQLAGVGQKRIVTEMRLPGSSEWKRAE